MTIPELIKSAETGCVNDQYTLACAYEKGLEVEKDDVQAFHWFDKAANGGSIEAQYRVGWYYYEGKVGTKDARKAFDWWKKAAEKGHARACFNIGHCYCYGEGIYSSTYEAGVWLRKAIGKGCNDARQLMDRMYTHRLQEIRKAAENGDSYAKFDLGYCYDNCLCIDLDYKNAQQAAVYWYEQAAKAEIPEACYEMARRYQHGLGVTKNINKTIDLLKIAGRSIKKANYDLAMLYYHGNEVPEDFEKAFHYFMNAASPECPEAYKYLGFFHELGLGTEQDDCLARMFYEYAIRYGDKSAQNWLDSLEEDIRKQKEAFLRWQEEKYEERFNKIIKTIAIIIGIVLFLIVNPKLRTAVTSVRERKAEQQAAAEYQAQMAISASFLDLDTTDNNQVLNYDKPTNVIEDVYGNEYEGPYYDFVDWASSEHDAFLNIDLSAYDYTRFTGLLIPWINKGASMVFKVYADGVCIYDSGEITHSSFAKYLELDVSRVKALTFTAVADGNSEHIALVDPMFFAD